jgi:hypothetical protein
MPKHTPGPWKVFVQKTDRLGAFATCVGAEAAPSWEQVYPATSSVGAKIAICSFKHPDDSDFSEEGAHLLRDMNLSNAHLIAASPDLLEALEKAYGQILEFLNEGDFKREVNWDAGYIVDAVKKAKGDTA